MTNNNKDIPPPPADPVGSARFAQRPISTPKTPGIQPNDASSRIKALLKPKINKVTGTEMAEAIFDHIPLYIIPDQRWEIYGIKPDKIPDIASDLELF